MKIEKNCFEENNAYTTEDEHTRGPMLFLWAFGRLLKWGLDPALFESVISASSIVTQCKLIPIVEILKRAFWVVIL